MPKKFYITTAIDYVNAKPHVGHAFEKTIADTIARWHRLQGDKVLFTTGVDENAQKNVQAAEKAGIPVKEFIDKNAEFFMLLCNKLNLSNDLFIRTTTKEHEKVVHNILAKIIKKGGIYKSSYEGLYCIGCETYYTEKDLINGKCSEHNKAPELRREEAYFFRLSKYKEPLLKLIPKYIIPASRAKEVISRIKEEGLEDICISRKGAKWGVDFPNDKDYKVWVWIDALINYISGLKEKDRVYWPAQLHIVGKGINWFHSVIWPALLLSSNYKLPEKLMVHGYLNIKGLKISKSLGNTIDPLELLNKYPTDTVRYSFLRNSIWDDSDYSEELLIKRHNTELANELGNLISRSTSMIEKYFNGKIPNGKNKLKFNIKKIEGYMENYELNLALSETWKYVQEINKYINKEKPWESNNKEEIIYTVADSIRIVTILLYSFIPETSEKISKQLGFKITSLKECKPNLLKSGTKIVKGEILFKKID